MQKSKLISELKKYKISEDYLTNTLVAILKELLNVRVLTGDRKIAYEILNLIATKTGDPSWTAKETPVFDCQLQTGDHKRPDITIKSQSSDGFSREVKIEVKDTAPVRPGQLADYKKSLIKDSNASYKGLVLISRPLVKIEDKDVTALDSHIYWHQIYKLISVIDKSNETTKYLLDSFMYFLEEKEMPLEEVKGTYANQKVMEDLVRLIAILKLALEGVKVKKPSIKLKRSDNIYTGPESWYGFYFTYKNQTFSLGVCTDEPSILELTLENEQINPSYPEISLDFMKNDFFEKSADKQILIVQEFVIEKLPILWEKSKVKHKA